MRERGYSYAEKDQSTDRFINFFTSILYHRFYFQLGAISWLAFISKINKAGSLAIYGSQGVVISSSSKDERS